MDSDPAEPIRVLILDGGDRRALSQLEILDKIMHRVEFDKMLEQRIIPYKYFHAIAGVGPGGILAAFLGILRMPIAEAQVEFINLYKFVFDRDDDDQETRSLKLQEFLKDLLLRKRFEANMPLQQTDGEECHVFLGCSFARDLTKFQVLRGYKNRDGPTKMTLVEALRATWADPEVFAPVIVGEEHRRIKYVGCDATFRNPAREAIKEVLRIYGGERRMACAISLGSGIAYSPPGVTTFERKVYAQVNSERTAAELRDQWGSTGVYHRLSSIVDENDSTDFTNILESTSTYVLEQEITLDACACALRSAMSTISLEDLYRSPTSIPKTSPQLPRLSSYFMDRPHVIEKMNNVFSRKVGDVMIISGMGGIGKTQIARKWAGDHANEFDFIMFIDASSQATLEADLVSGVSGLIGSKAVSTSKEALRILSGKGDGSLKNGLIVFDNADDSDINLARFMPTGDSYIIVTTRNQCLQSLAPEAYMELEVMPEDEAMKLLFKAAKIKDPTNEETEQATAIVQVLEFLPLAIVQAGSYIGKWHCIDTYLDKFKKSRAKLLTRPMGQILDKGHRAVYAALDVTIPSLSNEVKQLLQIFCFLRPMRISVRFILLAAKNGFSLQLPDLLPLSEVHEDNLRLLQSLFSPSDPWTELDTQHLIDDLQRYSLVTLTEDKETFITLRFHRLVLAWAHDQLMRVEERTEFQSAAICLLLAGTQEYAEDILGDIAPHILSLSTSPTWKHLQTNYRAAFLKVLRIYSSGEDLVKHWQEIELELAATDDLRQSEVSLQLADGHWRNGDEDIALQLEANAVELRKELLGPEDLSTLFAMKRQALGHYNRGSFTDAMKLQEEILKTRRSLSSTSTRQLALAIEDLAETYKALGLFGEAKELLVEALDLWTTIYGNEHSNIRKVKEGISELDACEGLDSDLEILDEDERVEEEKEEIYIGWRPWEDPFDAIWKGIHSKLCGITNLANLEHEAFFWTLKGRYDKVLIYREAILKTFIEEYGFEDYNTIEAIELLAQLYEYQNQKRDAITIRLWGIKRALERKGPPKPEEKPAAMLEALRQIGAHSKLITSIIKPEVARYLDQVIKHQRELKGINNTRAICVLERLWFVQRLSYPAWQQTRRIGALILALEIPIHINDAPLLEEVIRTLEFTLQSKYPTVSMERAEYSLDDRQYEPKIFQYENISSVRTQFDSMSRGDQDIFLSCWPSPSVQENLIAFLVYVRQNPSQLPPTELFIGLCHTSQRGLYDCGLYGCERQAMTKRAAILHLEGEEHLKFKFYKCNTCGCSFHHDDELREHECSYKGWMGALIRPPWAMTSWKDMGTGFGKGKFLCSCGRTYTNNRNRRRHQGHSKSCFSVD